MKFFALLFIFAVILQISLAANDAICSLPAETGPCRAYKPRYYYNSASGECEVFAYGGCGGNANNFNSLTDCEDTCK